MPELSETDRVLDADTQKRIAHDRYAGACAPAGDATRRSSQRKAQSPSTT